MEIKTDYSDIKFKDNGKLKLLIIVGTRPEIIRLAAVINKCRKYFDCILAHTGQNYDYNLNGVFFKDLKLDDPEVYMDAVGDDLGATVGNIINCSYKLMNQIKPDALLILGDTNSCLSAIAAKRLHIPILAAIAAIIISSTLLFKGLKHMNLNFSTIETIWILCVIGTVAYLVSFSIVNMMKKDNPQKGINRIFGWFQIFTASAFAFSTHSTAL